MFQMRAKRDALMIKKIFARKMMLIIALLYGQSQNVSFVPASLPDFLTEIQAMHAVQWLSQ